jgi:dihydropteroate synthase-like protein
MRYLFVTGKLAEPALRRTLADVAPLVGFDYDVAVLNISVAALMTPAWVARHLCVPGNVERIMLPGFCEGDLSSIQTTAQVPVELGPKDLRDLPEHFGRPARPDYGAYDIEIIAEINHCPQLSLAQILEQARHYRDSGADVIDLGCDPGATWSAVADAVRALRAEGMRVSIDSFNPVEVDAAVRAGAELVLSVNRANLEHARDWGCEVVAIPDVPAALDGLNEVVETLTAWNVKFRIDPVIEPIGFGFAASLGRYLEVRRRYPQAEIMMGVGNLTELTDVDSAGINVLLAGMCQELGIRSVLTTEVINWARSAVRELDLARRLMHYAVKHRVLPKHVEPRLLLLRDEKVREHGPAALAALAQRITDRNFRLFAEGGLIHVISGKMHLQGTDPFELFAAMAKRDDIDPSHAFYLGYEMAKAITALTLGKNYVQDQALDWGFLTLPEQSHRGRIKEDSTPEDRTP